MELNLKVGKIGQNKIVENFKLLDTFVQKNFEMLWIGAKRLHSPLIETINEDAFAPRRVYYRSLNLRLHETQGIKWIGNFSKKEGNYEDIYDNDIFNIYVFLRNLIKYAEKEIDSEFGIYIEYKKDKLN